MQSNFWAGSKIFELTQLILGTVKGQGIRNKLNILAYIIADNWFPNKKSSEFCTNPATSMNIFN